jgi:O-antigen/teichoic acid export membrane protein
VTQPRDLALLAATAAHPGFQATVTLLVYPALARLAAAGRTDRLVGRVLLVDRLLLGLALVALAGAVAAGAR